MIPGTNNIKYDRLYLGLSNTDVAHPKYMNAKWVF